MTDTLYLTGIRGFAVLIVLLGHLSNANIHLVPGLDLHRTAKAGVWLFFVLSAYLLTGKLVADLGGPSLRYALFSYTVRRILRVMPAYIAFLVVLWALGLMDWGAVLAHMTLERGDGHLWTIPVEMKFYVALPLLAFALALTPERWRWAPAAGMVAASVVVYYLAGPAKVAQNSISLANYLPFFCVGVLLAVLPGSRSSSWIAWAGIAGLVLLTPRSLSGLTGMTITQSLEWSWLFAPAWGAVMYGAQGGALVKLFRSRPLLFLGEISFSLYLVHYAIIAWFKDSAALGAFSGVAAAAASIAAAYLLYASVETYFRDLGYQLTNVHLRGTQPAE